MRVSTILEIFICVLISIALALNIALFIKSHKARTHHVHSLMSEAKYRADEESGRASDNKPVSLPALKPSHPLQPSKEDLYYVKYIESECGMGVKNIAECISFRNQIILNFKKAYKMGIR